MDGGWQSSFTVKKVRMELLVEDIGESGTDKAQPLRLTRNVIETSPH